MNTNNNYDHSEIINLALRHSKLPKNLSAKNLYKAAVSTERRTNPNNYKNRDINNNSTIVKIWEGRSNYYSDEYGLGSKMRVIAFEIAFSLYKNLNNIDYESILRKIGEPNYIDLYFHEDTMQFLYIELVYRYKITRQIARNKMENFYTNLLSWVRDRNDRGTSGLRRTIQNKNAKNIMKTKIFIPNRTRLNMQNVIKKLKFN
jgi:hypothetical protein